MTAFLVNSTRKVVLSQRGKVLRGASMALGAMFRGLAGEGLVFVWWREARIAITNLFVPEPIDILWLDSSWKVVDLHSRFAAGAWSTTNKRPAKYVVELAAGTLAKTKTKVGDTITCSTFKKP